MDFVPADLKALVKIARPPVSRTLPIVVVPFLKRDRTGGCTAVLRN